MPFYIRKSVSAGPFRFNFSKGGVGLSVGVRGFRLGTGPRGHYVHAGRGGLYYRKTLNASQSVRDGERRALSEPPAPNQRQPETISRIDMVAVSSGAVADMEDARFADVLAEMVEKQQSARLATVLMWCGIAFAALTTIVGGGIGFLLGATVAFGGRVLGSWLDESRRSVVLMYDLEDDAAKAYEAMTNAFDRVANCHGKWHVDAGGAVNDLVTWKRNAGASHVLDKRPTVFGYGLPTILKSNITPPSMSVGKETLFFLPDFLLVVHKESVGAVAYDQLSIVWQDSNFIEEGAVPGDTTVLFHTWKHPNKSGGPDRRFANNYQIPVCLYESIHLASPNGLNELLQVSCNGVAAPLAMAVTELSRCNGASAIDRSLPRLTSG
ncbi:DUF4236 domain-containing protein [Pacificimonas sp. WHA3]|uniref:DUF4236 domain-containing protein n=1 Tax=Pacificimonas pallii TaxID=2827236 RepID=A0ABS6SHH1_9SPHN|nr:DUF4236 domain-containing protein [Pacificimonas pallii]MBV7257870.1 DUF4236 domain-containing protein [Pacificimonas pallii]